MSAIAKPLIHTTFATLVDDREAEPISAEEIIGISKVNNLRPLPKKNDFAIVYQMKPSGGGRVITKEWIYSSESDRDAQYDAVLAAISTEIV